VGGQQRGEFPGRQQLEPGQLDAGAPVGRGQVCYRSQVARPGSNGGWW
jgi:hypothetical protein